MKTKGDYILSVILIQICLFSACDDPSSSNNTPNPPNTPNPNQYTVIFEANGGTPAPVNQIVNYGDIINTPLPMIKTGYGFGGWYKEVNFINEWDFEMDSVTGNITLYAKWDTNYFIVNFVANGGLPAPNSQNIAHGSKVIPPPEMINSGYTFGGWYKEETFVNKWDFYHDVININTTLYAKWNPPITITGANFLTKMNWLKSNAQNDFAYIIEINSNESIDPLVLSFSGKHNIYITLRGTGAKRVISLNSNGSMFTIEPGITLILDNNIELQGRNYNNAPLVMVNNGGNLILNNGASITSNDSRSIHGGGVNVAGTFTMNGGEISGNYSYHGGGVQVTGIFILNDGKISNNTASIYGGGVLIPAGTFIMNGGVISGNEGGNGGGVHARYPLIGNNLDPRATFSMIGGEISGNTGRFSGGGVFVRSSTFTMYGGLISGNTVNVILTPEYSIYQGGGGVYLSESSFNKNGGIITGYTEGNNNSNVVKDISGIIPQYKGHAIQAEAGLYSIGKDTAAGTTDNLLYNVTGNHASWSGAWDYQVNN